MTDALGTRPRLLVSVRSADEARDALAGGADIVDVKEPANGPLGRAAPHVLAEVAQVLRQAAPPQRPGSAALGELLELDPSAVLPTLDPHYEWVKVGFSGLAGGDWRHRCASLRNQLRIDRPNAQLITVVYADWTACDAPHPDELISAALADGVPGVLFDTCRKEGATLLDHLSLRTLKDYREALHAAGRFVALAGSLGVRQIDQLREIQPDVLAVRSAACLGGRHGRVDSGRVAEVLAAIDAGRPVRNAGVA